MMPPPRAFTLFPYTTLFRSCGPLEDQISGIGVVVDGDVAAANRGAPLRVPDVLVERQSAPRAHRSEEHTSELQSRGQLVCRLLLEKKNYSFILHLWLLVHST